MGDAPIPDAKAWMIKAWRDLETARRATGENPPFYDVAVYHCQQAAEKALKAFLVYQDEPYVKTHDIEVLVDVAGDFDPTFAKLSEAADALTPYATKFRYPNATFAIEPTPLEYREALKHAETIYSFVLNLLPSDMRPEEDK